MSDQGQQGPYRHDPYRQDPYAHDPYAQEPYPSAPQAPIPTQQASPADAEGPYLPAGGYPAYAPPQPLNVSALVLTIVSAMLSLTCYFTLAGVPALILGIVALTKQQTDPAGASRLAMWGWVVLGVVSLVVVLAIGALVAFAVTADTSTY